VFGPGESQRACKLAIVGGRRRRGGWRRRRRRSKCGASCKLT